MELSFEVVQTLKPAASKKQSGEILLKDIEKLLVSIKRQAIKHKYTLCIGRSHGIHAEPTTFGLKLAGYYAEFKRNKKRLMKEKNKLVNLPPQVKKMSTTKTEAKIFACTQSTEIGEDISKAFGVGLGKVSFYNFSDWSFCIFVRFF